MTGTRPPTPTPTPPSGAGAPPPIERAQAVWQAAVELADAPAPAGSGGALELLRTAGFDPSTLRHALTLGHTRLRVRPDDARLWDGWRLLQAATAWLGAPTDDGEVGHGGSGTAAEPGRPAPPADWPDDDLARQRRKREERLLARRLPNDPNVTVADVVAEVVAAAATAGAGTAGTRLDVPRYLAHQGHAPATIDTVVDYLDRHFAARTAPPTRR
ncbi:MAG TPA: hypothetical protein VIL48_12985 [Acidimicrobiales bacterium]